MANDEGAPDHRGTRRAACRAMFGGVLRSDRLWLGAQGIDCDLAMTQRSSGGTYETFTTRACCLHCLGHTCDGECGGPV